jgi:hypothetical protein
MKTMPRQRGAPSVRGSTSLSSARLAPNFKTSSHRPAVNTVKRTVEYLGVCNNPAAYRSVVRSAPDPVIKTICNAALNVERGAINLTPFQKTLFRQHRAEIAKLTSPRVRLDTKRRVIEQRGSGFFIPALIGAAISGLAGALFGGKKE